MRKSSLDIRVEIYDVDGMRTVYHPRYFYYFDWAKTKLLREAGFDLQELVEKNIFIPLVACTCEYKESAGFNDILRVGVEVEEIRGKVLTFFYEVKNMDTGRIIVTGRTKHVFVDENNKSFVLKERYPEIFESLTK